MSGQRGSSIAGSGSGAVPGDLTVGGDLVVGDDATFDVVTARRLHASVGPAPVAGDFVLSAGWGTTASVSNVRTGSTSQRGAITITSNGTGQAANPTTSWTPNGGAFPAGAIVNVRSNGGSGAGHTVFPSVPSTSPIVFTHGFTPVAGSTYVIEWNIVG